MGEGETRGLIAGLVSESIQLTDDVFDNVDRIVVEFAFPNGEDLPIVLFQRLAVFCVSLHVAFKLGNPRFSILRRCAPTFAAVVTMPVTPVDEDDGFVLWQHNVRRSRQLGDVLPESITSPMEKASGQLLRLRLGGIDPRH